MQALGSIAKNTAAMLFATLLRMASSFVLVIFVARYLGTEGMGKFSFLISLFWLFQTIASMGLQPFIVREVSREKSKSSVYLINSIYLSLLAAVLMAVVMAGFVKISDYEQNLFIATLFMGGALLSNTVNLVFHALFVAHEKAEFVLYGTTFENIAKLALGVFFILQGHGIVTLACIMAVSPFVSLIVNIFLYQKFIGKLSFKYDRKLSKEILLHIPTFTGISLFNALFWNADVILLSRLADMETVGFYSAALRIVGMIKLVLQSYKVAIQPVAAKTFKISMEEFQDFCRKSLQYIFMITIPICVGGMIVAPKIIILFFSEEFAASATIFRILVWLLIPYGMALVFASFLIASNHQKIDLRINIISSLTLILLCVILIPRYGAMGAAISVVSGQILFFLQQIIFISKHLFKVSLWKITQKIILASVVMGVIVYLLSSIHVLFNVAIGMGVFLMLLILTNELQVDEFKSLIKLKR